MAMNINQNCRLGNTEKSIKTSYKMKATIIDTLTLQNHFGLNWGGFC